jgi:peptide/nickel transport system substrate-binding protein
VQRRASKNPVDQGGWSIFHTWWPSDSILNPVLSAIVRGQGAGGWFGWFSNAKIEQLTGDFLSGMDQATRMKLTDATGRRHLARRQRSHSVSSISATVTRRI